MKVLITGICGYVGSRLAIRFAEALPDVLIVGIDNLSRRGAEKHLEPLQRIGAQLYRGDIRLASDMSNLPDVDWVVDCAANPAVLAGVTAASGCTSQQLLEHNLNGTLQVLEYCRERRAGLILLSTSRVYSIESLVRIPLNESSTRYEVSLPIPPDLKGFSVNGVAEDFSTKAPISLYGATKLASEIMANEYSSAFNFPVFINRCGVIGGAGQLGKIDQGIFSYWVYACALQRPLRYIGFNGSGKQIRDCITAEDVANIVLRQISSPADKSERTINVGGGINGAMSLLEITHLCETFFKRKITVECSTDSRPYDIPYYVTDIRRAMEIWDWQTTNPAEKIVLELCEWTTQNMDFIRSFFG